MKKLSIILVLIILGVIAFFVYNKKVNETSESVACTQEAKLCPDGSYVGRVGPKCEFQACPEPIVNDHQNLIVVSSPLPNEVIKSPLVVKGKARGNWYFEASFPVHLYDANGKELAVAPAQAKGEWMTTEFVPFEIALTFDKPATTTGTLVLQKDNASGLPEHDDSISIPIRFSP